MKKITPFLMFVDQADEALKLYTSVFKNCKINYENRFPEGTPMAGKLITASFILEDQEFAIFNGGPHFQFSEGVSFMVNCENQEEIDRLWTALTADGGAESQCGWLKDKFGLSWQIVPSNLGKLLSNPDGRATRAMMKMKKLIIADLENPAD